MSSLPENDPIPPCDPGTPAQTLSADPRLEENGPLPGAELFPASFSAADDAEPPYEQPLAELPLFHSFSQPEFSPPARIPHLGHLLLLLVLATLGLLGAALLTRSALHFHLFGISTPQQAADDIHYALGFQVANYLIAFCACLLVFPLVWQKSFMAGLQWNGAAALRLRRRLLSAALLCVVLAIADGLLFREHADAPIDKIFRAPGAAWLLFAFGVTCAPFFEEIVFRGFLLPGLCTAWDWAIERSTGKAPLPLDAEGHPQWSLFAMAVGSLFTSIPFALMHGEQNGYALGPFLLLLCVSLVLCWARLSARSLAASVLVHASYNFLLFSFMMLGTGGFKHLDKM